MRLWSRLRHSARGVGTESGGAAAPGPLPSPPGTDEAVLPVEWTPSAPVRDESRRLKVKVGRAAIGAGGNLSGNAIGENSSAMLVEQMIVHAPAGTPVYRRRQLAPPPPLGQVAERKAIRQAVEAILLQGSREGRAPVLFLEGYGGGGKTTVALQTCQFPDIQDRFRGGVIWTAIGQSRRGPDLASHIADICEHLSGRRPTTTDPTMAGAALGEILDEGAPVLLLVDDVWFAEQVESFLAGGADSARLFTTRNRGLAPSFAKVIEVGEMTHDEARATAMAGLPLLSPGSTESLLRFAKGWPVLLGLINASLRVHIGAGGPPEEVTSWIADLIGSDGPTALDSTAPQHLGPSIAATVAASLDRLSQDEQARYFELAVFQEDIDIPERMASLLWNTTGNLSRTESRRVTGLLSALRLVSDRWSNGEPAIAVHDVLRSYVLHRLSPFDLARGHLALVTALRNLLPPDAKSEWWQLPPTEAFAMQHLPYHLKAARLHSELAELSCDLRWIEAQIRRLGSVVPAVSALSGIETAQASALHNVLERESEILVPDAAPSAIGATLASRLHGINVLSGMADQHLARLPRPLLRAYWPLPDAASTRDEGHSGPIGDCVISPRGDLIATASDDRLVILWDLATLTIRRVLRGHRQRARACVFSPDGSQLLSASMDGTIRIWSVDGGGSLHTLGNPSVRMLGCAWSPDGRLVASAAGDGTLTIWDAETGEKNLEIHSPSQYEWDCSFSPDLRTLASAAEDGFIRIWDLEQGDLMASFKIHEDRIRCCTYSPSGTLIASASSDSTVTIVHSNTGELLHNLRGHTDRVRACAFSSDGSLLVSAAEDRSIRLWDVATGQEIQSFLGHTDWVGACVFTPDSRHLVSCGGDAALRVWNVGSNESARTARATRNAVGCCAFSPDGSQLVTGDSNGMVHLRDTVTAEVVLSVTAHTGRVLDCSFGDGGFLTAGGDGEVRLWDADSGGPRIQFSGHSGRTWGCSIAADGSEMASAGEDGLVKVHDLRTGAIVHVLRGHTGHALDCAFSPSGEIIASVGDDGSLRLWNRRTGSLESALSTERETALWSCRFSPDGALIATVGEPAGALTLWSTTGRTTSSSIPIGVDRITSCAFSPSGKQIATCGDDGYLGVWDVATGVPVGGIRVAYPLHKCSWTSIRGTVLIAAAGNGGLYLFEYIGN